MWVENIKTSKKWFVEEEFGKRLLRNEDFAECVEVEEEESIDLYMLSKVELEKVNKPIIAAFLDKEEIEYDPKATKDELVALIVGE